MQVDPRQILNQYWGFSDFRSQQGDVVRSVLLGNDTLALMPTGGGKSICFQVPGLSREGICIVISPLVALMKDQVDGLKRKDIRAAYLTSAQSYREMDAILDSAIYGDMKFLYVSPERLQNELFIERFKQMNVNLIAIDEAHCISQWGHDFRPAYRQIVSARDYHPDVPILAVTASATPAVADDIAEQLGLKDVARFEAPMTRSNLSYAAIEEPEPLGRLLKICQRLSGSGIVYGSTRKAVRSIAGFLQSNGIACNFYHAGLDHKRKMQLQSDWLSGKFPIMIATNAFGMGIDKPDVRFVVHVRPPINIENYVQEAGRAGRDGEESWSILLWNTELIEETDRELAKRFPPKESIKETYDRLCAHLGIAYAAGIGTAHSFAIGEFCRKYGLNTREVHFELESLQHAEYIHLSEGALLPSRVMFILKNQELYNFQVRHDEFDAFIRLMLRTYGGVFDQYTRIDEGFLARKTGWGADKVRDTLQRLDNMQVLSYHPQTDVPTLTLLTGRQKKENLVIPPEAYENRMERLFGRWDNMKAFLHDEACRSVSIAAYFGDQTAEKCGKCDWCRREGIKPKDVRKAIKEELQSSAQDLNTLIDKLSDFLREDIISQVHFSIDEGEILRDDEDLLHWHTK